MLSKELIALESAITELEMLFQSLVFPSEEEAKAIRNRLMRAERRVRALTELSSPEDLK